MCERLHCCLRPTAAAGLRPWSGVHDPHGGRSAPGDRWSEQRKRIFEGAVHFARVRSMRSCSRACVRQHDKVQVHCCRVLCVSRNTVERGCAVPAENSSRPWHFRKLPSTSRRKPTKLLCYDWVFRFRSRVAWCMCSCPGSDGSQRQPGVDGVSGRGAPTRWPWARADPAVPRRLRRGGAAALASAEPGGCC
jgi:hypothetical protein